jgi:uncharacterized membrane protein YraQ (UPF0718 family)
MKTQNQKKALNGMVRDSLIFVFVFSAALILLSFFPHRRPKFFDVSWDFFIEMLTILPAVMILMGLFSVFVPKDEIVKYLGKTSGLKGIALALFFGALPTGPLYVAFPMAAVLIKKGARISNIIIFLSAWACIKIPQEMMELQFLGFKFMLLRLVLTILFVVGMGKIIEVIIEWTETNKPHQREKADPKKDARLQNYK